MENWKHSVGRVCFDRTIDPIEALATIIESGAHRILTSGQVPNAFDGKDLIKQLIEVAENNIIIMPGSGVRVSNIKDLQAFTGAKELHSSARISVNSFMEYQPISMNENMKNTQVDAAEIKAMKTQIS